MPYLCAVLQGTMTEIIDIFLHLDKHLNELFAAYGTLIYLILFLIIFAETGLVVAPFLPGDSLLFATGALAASEGSTLSLPLLLGLLFVAAVVGDGVNYSIGNYIGPKAFSINSRFLKQEHLRQTQTFYEKHGGKTIILARFMPIVRTLAPFVAGIGRMKYSQFALYNVLGGAIWVGSFLLLGYFFGNQPIVKKNFSLVVLGIIVVSVMPAVWEVIKARRSKPQA